MVVYSKEYLEDWRKKVVEPHVKDAVKIGLDALKADNMTDFVLAISRIAQDTENHVDLNCIYAESMPLGIKCTKDAKKLRADALNKLTEALVEKCGGKMNYIIMD